MTDEGRQELEALRSRIAEVEGVVERLGDRLVRLESGAAEASASRSDAPARPRRSPVVPPPPKRSGPSAAERLTGWAREFLSQGNPLNKLGALSLMVGAAIVFKYAVDNGWIGPTGRVVLGLAVGAGLLAVAEVYARRSWQRFASGLASGGIGVVFIAIWFGQQRYEVVPPALAFALYVATTAFVVAQSLRYDSMPLAVWSLVGGYLTPALASTGSGNYVLLSSYLLVLNAGVLAIAYRREWQPLKWMAFVLTALYTASWVFEFADRSGETRWLQLHWLLPFLAAFFVSFWAIPAWRSLRLRQPIDLFGQALTVANGVIHFGLVAIALHDEHRAWLGLVATIVALFYAVVASLLTRQANLDERGLRVFASSAAGFLLLATPYLATGHWITLVWCAETALLAWVCTQPPFAFLRFHVLAMLVVVLGRLVGFDGLFGLEAETVAAAERYVPFAELRSWPPFAAVLTFAWVARMLDGSRDVRFPLAPVSVVLSVGGLLLVAGIDAEASRLAHGTLAPLASDELIRLVRAGVLTAVVVGVWLAAGRFLPGGLSWWAQLAIAGALVLWTLEALVWPGGYTTMERILGHGAGLWWLHGGVLLMAPLLFLLLRLVGDTPEDARGLTREQLRGLLLGAGLVIAMLLLRREAFAITHAPPLMDWIPDEARRAGYRSILSVSYALLAFGVYVHAVRSSQKMQLYAAYALYIFTALKVYLFDLSSQNQLYRASSLIIFAAILFVSSYYANRRPEVDGARAET